MASGTIYVLYRGIVGRRDAFSFAMGLVAVEGVVFFANLHRDGRPAGGKG